MAAIKIRSLDDIIKVYLENFGFNPKQAESGVKYLVENRKIDHDNVTASLDRLLLDSARKIYPERALNDEQKTAMLKLAFMLGNGAKKWEAESLFRENPDERLVESMRGNAIVPAPEYVLSQMMPQPIEMPGGLLKKLWGGKKK